MEILENLIHYIIVALIILGLARSAWAYIQAMITKRKWDNEHLK